MALADVDVPQSDAWWMQYMARQLQAKQPRLRLLDDYWRGRPPLVLGSESLQTAFYRFQRVARSNFAALIVGALVERQAVRSIRTAEAGDDNGDQTAWAMFTANNLDIDMTDVLGTMGKFGEAYMAAALPDEGDDQPVITGEDPRQVITVSDPVNPRKTLAAFKLFHDDQQGKDFAYLWLPGRRVVASRDRKARMPAPQRAAWALLDGPPPPTPVSFSPSTFTVEDDMSEDYAVLDVPVVRFGNRDGVGEFELHTDLLDRINHMILQRIVIATLQAFKQRAIELAADATDDPNDPKGLPTHDEDGNEIDYDDLFSADPGALWRLPVGAKIWESGQVDLTGILSSVKDDVMHLASVTKTPFPMFTPDAANQTAEGAQLTREGLVFKVEDRNRIAGRALAQIVSIGFKFLGDEQRAKLSGIVVDWMPAERFSLAEKASADSLAVSLPFEQKLRLIWQLPPSEVQQAKAQRASDAMLAAIAGPAATPPRLSPPPTDPAASDVPAA